MPNVWSSIGPRSISGCIQPRRVAVDPPAPGSPAHYDSARCGERCSRWCSARRRSWPAPRMRPAASRSARRSARRCRLRPRAAGARHVVPLPLTEAGSERATSASTRAELKRIARGRGAAARAGGRARHSALPGVRAELERLGARPEAFEPIGVLAATVPVGRRARPGPRRRPAGRLRRARQRGAHRGRPARRRRPGHRPQVHVVLRRRARGRRARRRRRRLAALRSRCSTPGLDTAPPGDRRPDRAHVRHRHARPPTCSTSSATGRS